MYSRCSFRHPVWQPFRTQKAGPHVVDAYLIRCHAAQLKILDGPQQLAADVNRDGRINVVDAYLVRCYAAQLINEFPAA